MRFSLLSRARGIVRSVAAGLGAAAALAAGCGESEGRPIPSGGAQDIVAALEDVQQGVDASACTNVRQSSLPQLQDEVDDLPSSVDRDVRTTLEDGVGRLEELVRAECQEPAEPAPTTPEPDVTPEPDPQPEPTPEPDPTPQPTEPDGTTPPDGGGTGDGGTGNGNGSGGGGGDDGGGDDGGGSPGGGGDESGSLSPGGTGGGDPGGVAGPGSTGEAGTGTSSQTEEGPA
jgi:hypothetical protein